MGKPGIKESIFFVATMAVLAVFSVYRFGFTLQGLVVFAVSCTLAAAAFIDGKTMMIPDSLNAIILILGIVGIFVFPDITLASRAIGFFIVSAPMLLLNAVIKDGFGGGDVKLCAACGFLLGWQNVIVAALLAFLAGGLYGACLLISKKKGRGDSFAFGPFLAFGMLCALFAADDWVQSLFLL